MFSTHPMNHKASLVNVQYFVERGGNDTTMTSYEPIIYVYAFRWSASFVFALIRPELLQPLSLYIYYGYTPTVNIIIDPLCGMDMVHNITSYDTICHGQGNAHDPVQLISKLTTHVSILIHYSMYCASFFYHALSFYSMQLKGYAKDKRLLGVDEESRGYSSFLFNRDNTNDHCVIGQVEKYKNIRIMVFIIMFLTNLVGVTYLLQE